MKTGILIRLSSELMNDRNSSFYGELKAAGQIREWKVMILNSSFIKKSSSPKKIYEHKRENQLSEIDVTFVMPVHNQEEIIFENLRSLMECISLNCEIIVIDDASSDDSLSEIMRAVKIGLPSYIQFLSVYRFSRSKFETTCDDFGIRQSRGKYIIELQADMQVTEKCFDKKMLSVLYTNKDIFMLSGRGIMTFAEIYETYRNSRGTESITSRNVLNSILRNFKVLLMNREMKSSTNQSIPESNRSSSNVDNLIFPSRENFIKLRRAGRLGNLIEVVPASPSGSLYVGETVMRGPICFEKQRYLDLGGFDLSSFFLGFDEHDLNLRAHLQKDWLSGFVYVEFSSPLMHGSMRRKRKLRDKFELHRATKRISKTSGSALARFNSISSSFASRLEVRRVQNEVRSTL